MWLYLFINKQSPIGIKFNSKDNVILVGAGVNQEGQTTDPEIMNLATGEKNSLSGLPLDETFKVDFAGLQDEESPVICGEE